MKSDWEMHLQAASGYLDLGMIDDAANEIEEIDPGEKMRIEVLAFRVELFRTAQKWEGMEVVSAHLLKLQPGELKWVIDLAWAVRRSTGIPEAWKILEEAAPRFPDCALIHYNLACYACVLGEIEEAKTGLEKAFALDKNLRAIALDDPDLDALFGRQKSGVTP